MDNPGSLAYAQKKIESHCEKYIFRGVSPAKTKISLNLQYALL